MRIINGASTHLRRTTLPSKKKFFITGLFSKYDQMRSFLQIWSHLLKKAVIVNFFFCAVSSDLNRIHATHHWMNNLQQKQKKVIVTPS